MQHGDIKIFINILKQEIISPKNNEEPHGALRTHITPLHVLRNTTVPWNPCWRILS